MSTYNDSQAERSEHDPEVAHVLTASVHDIKHFAALLRGIQINKIASVLVSSTGLIVSVEESKTLLATAYIFPEVFDEYNYTPEPQPQSQFPTQNSAGSGQDEQPNAAFDINLPTLLECLNILGTAGPLNANLKPNEKAHRFHRADEDTDREDNEAGPSRRSGRNNSGGTGSNRIDQYFGGGKGTGMRLSYAGTGYPLTLMIAEEADGPTATCEVTTFDPEPRLELPFDMDRTAMRIILKSSWLRDALSEIEPSCEKLTIIGNPPPAAGRAPRLSAPPRLRLRATGKWGTTEMDYPNDREVLETCECPTVVNFSYKFSSVTKAQRALQSSTKTSLRIDEDGLLSLQFLMPSPRGQGKASEAFVEYRCIALEDD